LRISPGRAGEPVALAAISGNQVSELVALAAIVLVLDFQLPWEAAEVAASSAKR
jgi:hypothetical protein